MALTQRDPVPPPPRSILQDPNKALLKTNHSISHGAKNRSRASDHQSPRRNQDRHTSLEPQDLDTTVAALAKATLALLG